MRLEDVTERGQFKAYYAERGLATAEAKIVHLKEAMGIRMVRQHNATEDEMLEGLEESVLFGSWRYLNH